MEFCYQMNKRRIVQTGNTYLYKDMVAQLKQLQCAYPHFEVLEIGRSVMGKPLYCIRLGSGPKAFHMNGAVHANEWITAPLLLRFIEETLASTVESSERWSREACSWLKEITLWAVPMVNPDGVNLSQEGITPAHANAGQLLAWNQGSTDFSRWKANIQGVDLNDQFPAYWEEEQRRRAILMPSAQDYGGTAPLTEPESKALAVLTRCEDFDLAVSLHTQGKEIYWNYRDMEPSYAEHLARRLAYVSGYRAVKLTGSDAGYKDWFIQEFRRPGFTIEAGEGVNPLPASDFESIYAEVSELLAEVMRF
ncbi:M14 family metallopeptidase [Paenibacillus tuaregi]|uniref:M14 family metallopeptidase n=1 Tax=Paenibacillus tuaregi TaxID=1816681 RepID=UPI000ADAFD66|nr:M14 family metallocarboxypeptidase [Paenibacillus tuaregi]